MKRSQLTPNPPKPRPCKHCGTLTDNTPAFCSPVCAYAVHEVKKAKAKANLIKDTEREYNAETRRRKEAIRKRTGAGGYYDSYKKALHKYIKHVLRKGEDCYTCGLQQKNSDKPQSFHVGHFMPAGTVDPRRFMLENLRIQCQRCNSYNSGRHGVYKERLIKEMGQDHVDWLECDVNHKSLKEQYPEISDIKAKIKYYNLKIKLEG